MMSATMLSDTSFLQNQNKGLLETVEKLRLKISTLEKEIKILKEGKDISVSGTQAGSSFLSLCCITHAWLILVFFLISIIYNIEDS